MADLSSCSSAWVFFFFPSSLLTDVSVYSQTWVIHLKLTHDPNSKTCYVPELTEGVTLYFRELLKCGRKTMKRSWRPSRGSLPPAAPSEAFAAAFAVTGALTQIFEEGQRQDDPDRHKYHQVVPIQVPFAAGEFGRGQSWLFHPCMREI